MTSVLDHRLYKVIQYIYVRLVREVRGCFLLFFSFLEEEECNDYTDRDQRDRTFNRTVGIEKLR